QVFKNATMAFSKSESNITKVLPAMIHDVLESDSANTSYFPAMKSALAVGTRLLSHYYTLADRSMVYRFATILHPSYKLEYFKNAEWPDQWV
ncbi:hypothetical protein BC827DRAFT_1089965, partial [Russula dissimulans]